MRSAYRFYRLDGAGNIVEADWLDAEDDEDAAAKARERSAGAASEVWDRNRLVVRIEAGKRS